MCLSLMNMTDHSRVLLVLLIFLRCALIISSVGGGVFNDNSQERRQSRSTELDVGVGIGLPNDSKLSKYHRNQSIRLLDRMLINGRNDPTVISHSVKRAVPRRKRRTTVPDHNIESMKRSNYIEARGTMWLPSTGRLTKTISDAEFWNSLHTSERKRNSNECTVTYPTVSNCTRAQYLCWGMNHPQCQVRYPAPPSTTFTASRCRVIVRCDYTNDFPRNNGVCFAGRKAFPSPLLHSVDGSNLIYRYNLRLYNNETMMSSLIVERTRINAVQHVSEQIRDFARSGLTSFTITTDYSCAHMTPCSFHEVYNAE